MKAKIFVYALPALFLATIHPAEAQQPKVSRIGYLSPLTPSSDSNRIDVFRQGLRELGYVEGQNIAMAKYFCPNAIPQIEKAIRRARFPA